ncbi:MAG: glycoside hydrolase family 3 N-terminal domain-containing protein [Candidatus Nanopelagicales bacterium]
MEKPWLDATLPVERRVESLLSAMTLAEKVGQLNQPANVSAGDDAHALRAGAIGTSLSASGATAGNVRDEGVAVRAVNEVQRIAVEQSRLGIPVLIARDVIHGHRTMFPIPLGQAATWDEAMIERAARLAASEASAVGIQWTFTPMMDITGDHRWGRVAESLGEDPVLAGRLAAAMIHGFQTDHLSAPEAIAATAKHYVGYGLAEGGRDYNTVTAGENSLRNLQLRPFHAAVDAGVATVMASFNDLDGTPAHANRRYVREILKDEWGWDGAVVSDWEGVGELVPHRVAADLSQAAELSIAAGVDIDMVTAAYCQHLAALVEAGTVPPEGVDDAVRRVLRLKFRSGLFEHPYTDESREHAVTGSSAHREASRQTAAASLVLLRNEGGILPLDPARMPKTVFTGPLLDATDALLGTWTLDGRGEETVTISAALAERLPSPPVAIPWNHADEVLWHARSADTVVAFVGEHPCRSGEANSVASVELPPGQLELLQAIKAAGCRLIAVVFAGRGMALPWLAEHADALVYAWHPGSEGGNAVADVLFGDVAPRGRLPISLPRSTGQLPVVYNHRSTGRPLTHDRLDGRYRDSLAAPQYPFGFGLTYGSFRYSDPRIDQARVAATITNEGDRPVTEVVQCYFRDEVAAITRPVRELYDWALVELAPGESRTVGFDIVANRLGYYGPDNTYRVDPGAFTFWIAPDSAAGEGIGWELT